MNRRILCTAIMAVALAGCEQPADDQKAQQASAELAGEQEKVSYGMGYNLGSRIKQEFDLDVDAFTSGVRHAVEGGEPLMTDEEIMQELQAFQQRQVEKREAEAQAQAESNLKESQQFLEQNAQKEGVTVTDSGLQYQVLEEGDGAKPGPQDVVKVHYKGELVNGEVFDSSYERGEPVEFPVHAVIPGWTEALQLMTVGSKYMLYIPPDLAYGPAGTGGPIGPNQALIFEVELLDITTEEEQAAEGEAAEGEAAEG